MSMVWGSRTFCVPDVSSVEGMINGAAAIAKQELFAANRDIVAILAGLPFGQTGTTNLLYMHRMEVPLM
jgi:pyruvate kinase